MEGVYFGLKHSEDYYHAIMNYARIEPPEVKRNYVDIPGGDSSIDLTEAVGGVRLKNGKLNFKFSFIGGQKDAEILINDIHGMNKTITLDRDKLHEMEGRIVVTRAEIEGNIYVVEATATVSPYKTEKRLTIHEENVSKLKEIILMNDRKPVVPRLIVEGTVTILFENTRYRLTEGTYEIPEITMYNGINRFTLYGDGRIRFEYRKGKIIC